MTAHTSPRPLLAMPGDFRAVAPTLTRVGLMAHYGKHHTIIERWLREAGVKAIPNRPGVKPGKKAHRPDKITGYRKLKRGQKRSYIAANIQFRDLSTEGQAADVLRHYAAVYRCDEGGAANLHGSWWRYGFAILDRAELLAKARRHGFNPDAWRTIGGSIAACAHAG